MTNEEALRRRVLKDPVAYFIEWARVGDRQGAWRALQARRLGPYTMFNETQFRSFNEGFAQREEYRSIAEDVQAHKQQVVA